MIKQTLECIAEMFGLKEPDTTAVAQAPFIGTAVFPIQDLRYATRAKDEMHVFASAVRAKELAIHLRNKYGESWMEHVNEIHGEDEEVVYELNQFVKLNLDVEYPWVSMTTDNIPVVINGRHTICAYGDLGCTNIRVTIGQPHRKSSGQLDLKPFSEITVYLSRANKVPIDRKYVPAPTA